MEKKEMAVILSIAIIAILSIYFFSGLTGNLIKVSDDQFSEIEGLHWTHMPLAYSIKDKTECKNRIDSIKNAFRKIEEQTNNSVSFTENEKNPDIEISCSYLEDCYEEKTERKWFWIITTEAICSHETGKAKLTKIKGDKILNAEINFAVIEEKEKNCSETEIHEILHAFGFEHKNDTNSIMYALKQNHFDCNEKIDKDIIDDLIKKYKK